VRRFRLIGEAQQAQEGQQQHKRGDGRGAWTEAGHASPLGWRVISAARC
jgi:hypothetical protein